jgi:hypothetical protein
VDQCVTGFVTENVPTTATPDKRASGWCRPASAVQTSRHDAPPLQGGVCRVVLRVDKGASAGAGQLPWPSSGRHSYLRSVRGRRYRHAGCAHPMRTLPSDVPPGGGPVTSVPAQGLVADHPFLAGLGVHDQFLRDPDEGPPISRRPRRDRHVRRGWRGGRPGRGRRDRSLRRRRSGRRAGRGWGRRGRVGASRRRRSRTRAWRASRLAGRARMPR